jgi:hypothetical protein
LLTHGVALYFNVKIFTRRGEHRRRADELQGRLQKRMAQLDLEAQVSALPPVALGGLVVVPAGLIAQMTGRPLPEAAQAVDTQASAARAPS